MCLSPDAYVAVQVFRRLVAKGVEPERAEAIARKVKQAYARKHAHDLRRDPPHPPRTPHEALSDLQSLGDGIWDS